MEEANEKIDFNSIPLQERLVHKKWDARQHAYLELAKIFKNLPADSENEYKKYQEHLKKIVVDTNLIAQETGIQTLLNFITYSPHPDRTTKVLVPLLIEKCVASMRAGTRAKTLECLLMYIEIDTAEPVIECLIAGLDHKNPKITTACFFALKEAVRAFGVKVVQPKLILNKLSKAFDHKDKNVRAEGTALAIELYKYLGANTMNQFLSDLKPVQLKELTEEFEKIPNEKRTPERFLRSEQQNKNENSAFQDNIEAEVAEAPDPYEFVDAVPILDKIPKTFYEEMASPKWQLRKEALTNLLAIVQSPKIEDGKYGELIALLGKKVADNNIVVATLSTNCITCIAKGLRNNFQQYKGLVISQLIERSKEKKTNVIEAVRSALDAVFASYGTINETLAEDMSAAFLHKNPQVKVESIMWFIRSLKLSKKTPGKSELKSFIENLMTNLDDGDNNVRNASAEGLGTLLKSLGERSILNTYLEKVDPIKMQKIKEFCEKAETTMKGKPGVVKSNTGAINNINQKIAMEQPTVKQLGKPKSRQASATGSKKILAKKKAEETTSTKPSQNFSAASSSKINNLDLVFKFTDDDAENFLNEIMQVDDVEENDSTIGLVDGGNEEMDSAAPVIALKGYQDLSSSNWKLRLAAMQLLLNKLKSDSVRNIEAELIFRGLLKKPGFKENNFQVMTNFLQIIKFCVLNFTCSPGSASLVISGLTEKLGDMKVKKIAGDCLASLAEATTFGFVLSQMYETVKKQKSPKVIADCLNYIQQTLLEFGAKGINLKDLIEFTKVFLGNNNQTVRTNAINLLKTLRIFVGAEIKIFVADMNPSILSTINAEFEKVENQKPPNPTRFSKLLSVPSSHNNPASGDRVIEEEDMVDNLFPRVDITSKISDELVEKLSNVQWKIRKEGLEELSAIIESTNRRIKSDLGNDLIPALKARLGDANRNLAVITLDILSVLAISVGKPFDKYSKQICSSVMSCLSENKSQIRGAAIQALDSIYTASGFENMISSISQSLLLEQPLLRRDLLKWCAEKLEECESQDRIKLDQEQTLPILHPVFLCLQDRNNDVRKFSQTLLGTLVKFLGYPVVKDRASEFFHGSQLQAILAFVEQAKPSTVATGKIRAGTPSNLIKANTVNDELLQPSGVSKIGGEIKNVKKISKPGNVSQIFSTQKKDAEVPLGKKCFPILSSDFRMKELRGEKDRGMNKWVFESPRKELINFLQEQCEGNFFNEYREKDYLLALSTLIEPLVSKESLEEIFGITLEELQSRYVANADLIFKYVTLRFFDTNTSMLIKCLELLEGLISVLDDVGYHLTEYEASSFLPFFINKAGDSKETMRLKIRGIMKQFCRIYPASKMFAYILKGLESKNARTRIECLEELATLIQRNGLSVCGSPSKAFPIVAAQIADRDAGVRNSAINVVTQAYVLVGGEQVFKYIGRIADKDKSLLEEKFKRMPQPSQSHSFSNNNEKNEVLETENVEFSQRISAPENIRDLPNLGRESPKSSIKNEFSLDFEKFEFPNSKTVVAASDSNFVGRSTYSLESENNMLDFVINQVTDTDPDISITALKNLEKALSTSPESLEPHIDDIVRSITLQIRIAFTAADISNPAISRLCKHLVNMLVQLFSNSKLAKLLSRELLHQCVKELINRLLDKNIDKIENSSQLTKAVNVLMVRILESCDRNDTFSVLLEILDTSSQLLKDCRPDEISRQSKYVELVMKCLWKLTKIIPQLVQSKTLRINQLLLDVHNFLVSSPPNEWKRRATEKLIPQADMPLRTIKTILHEFATLLGDNVFEHLELIPDVHTSTAVAYLKSMVEASRKKNEKTSPVPQVKLGGMVTAQTESSIPATSKKEALSAVDDSADVYSTEIAITTDRFLSEDDAKRELAEIFDKIRDKNLTKQGISELYVFQTNFGTSRMVENLIEEFICSTGTYFQGYIRRGLKALADEESSVKHGTSMTSSVTAMTSMPFKRERPASMIARITNLYTEKLEKLQQKFRGEVIHLIYPVNLHTFAFKQSQSVTAEDSDSPTIIRSSSLRNESKSRPLSTDSHFAQSSSLTREQRARGNEGEVQSYEALKERLNKMKLNMSKQ
ncbi:Cytoskeleton associated protein 5 [Clydaea vesicula]|uniref:Cytoskeleton associated protein 5 n=1 Tax=Clydaea vesicula TaxID=447962 RepID=A0AAD5U5U1_9FUNG|nr:Cytoskeleton associated protein 5 [Clydaea vesicula]